MTPARPSNRALVALIADARRHISIGALFRSAHMLREGSPSSFHLPAACRPGLAKFTQGCIDLFGNLLRDCRLAIHWHEAALAPGEVGTHVRSTKVKTVLVTADFGGRPWLFTQIAHDAGFSLLHETPPSSRVSLTEGYHQPRQNEKAAIARGLFDFFNFKLSTFNCRPNGRRSLTSELSSHAPLRFQI